jgi:hypothetical protein
MNQAIEKCAGRQHHCRGRQYLTRLGRDATDRTFRDNEILYGRSPQFEARDLTEAGLHRRAVEATVGLGSRPADGRTFAAIEQPELDSSAVSYPTHHAIEGIDLAHEMAFAQATNSRVAGHFPYGFNPVGHKAGVRAGARSRCRRLAASVSAANYDDIKARHGGQT